MENIDDETRKEQEAVVIADYGGILPYCEAFYIESIISPLIAVKMPSRGTMSHVRAERPAVRPWSWQPFKKA
jgi:hypothetical protein